MKRSKFTQDQIIAILREREDGRGSPQARVGSDTFHACKAKFGGMEPP